MLKLLSIMLLSPVSLFCQTAPGPRIINADYSDSLGPTSRMYNFCVGAAEQTKA